MHMSDCALLETHAVSAQIPFVVCGMQAKREVGSVLLF